MAKTLALVIAALLLALSSLPAKAERASIILFDGPDGTGASVTIEGDVKNLSNVGFNDRTSSLVVLNGTWQLCADKDFKGACQSFGQGVHNLGSLSDKASSLRLLAPGTSDKAAAIVLYVNKDGGGDSIRVTGAVPNLGAYSGFNDKVSSVAIFRGTWQLCRDSSYKGACATLAPGVHNLQNKDNDSLSSLRPVK